jgi:hypothetical protein
MKVSFGPGSELRIHGASVLEIVGVLAAAPAPAPQVSHAGCDFDDCTLDAVYCVGHALELAQVSDVEEAPKIRAALVAMMGALQAHVTAIAEDRPFQRIETWGDLMLAAKAASETLKRYPQ